MNRINIFSEIRCHADFYFQSLLCAQWIYDAKRSETLEKWLYVKFTSDISEENISLVIGNSFNILIISFDKEFKSLYKERIFITLIKPIPKSFQHFLKVTIAMLIIASPLPDEAGVTLLANGYRLPSALFYLLSLSLNTMGIYLILYTGQSL